MSKRKTVVNVEQSGARTRNRTRNNANPAALYQASERGDLDKARWLLSDEQTDVNWVNPNEVSRL